MDPLPEVKRKFDSISPVNTLVCPISAAAAAAVTAPPTEAAAPGAAMERAVATETAAAAAATLSAHVAKIETRDEVETLSPPVNSEQRAAPPVAPRPPPPVAPRPPKHLIPRYRGGMNPSNGD